MATPWNMTAPRFTDEDWEKERASMSDRDRALTQAEIRGTTPPPRPPVSEEASLSELRRALDDLPQCRKKEFQEACRRCPEIVNDRKMSLHFLRCVNFNPEHAASRIVCYWEHRVRLFGSAKAFLPLTIENSMCYDTEALTGGSIRMLPDRDDSGRKVLYNDRSLLRLDQYSRISVERVFFYMAHATLEEMGPRANGYVFLLLPNIYHFDRKLYRRFFELNECLPARITAFHNLLPTKFFDFFDPMIKFVMGPNLRRVYVIHSQSKKENLELLGTCGLSEERLPNEIGGGVKLDHSKWLEDQRRSGR